MGSLAVITWSTIISGLFPARLLPTHMIPLNVPLPSARVLVVGVRLILLSFLPVNAQNPSRPDLWGQRGEEYMKNEPKFERLSQTERRRLAEPWLLSAWQNRTSLPPETRRNIGLRLLQARIGNSNYLQAQETLLELERDTDFRICQSKVGERELGTLYSCAELERLASNLQYNWYSQANLNFLASRNERCSVLFHPIRGVPTCLEIARRRSESSTTRFQELRKRVASQKHVGPLCRFLVVGVRCGEQDVDNKLAEREQQTQVTTGLALQESGFPELALKLFSQLAVDPKSRVRSNAMLHRVRTLIDLNHVPEASVDLEQLRTEMEAITRPSAGVLDLRWRIKLVSARLLLRAGDRGEALRSLGQAFELREQILRDSLQNTGVFDLESRLTEWANSEDILLSVLLRADPAKSDSKLFSTYSAAILGASDFAFRSLFRALRKDPRLHKSLVEAVNSEPGSWAFGSPKSDRRVIALEELEKRLSEWERPSLKLAKASDVWDHLWQVQGTRTTELVVVLLYRPYRFDRPTSQAMAPAEYLMLHWQNRNSSPRVVELGSADVRNREIEEIRRSSEGNYINRASLMSLSQKMDLPAIPAGKPPRRLLLLAMGQFQHLPWAMLRDKTGKELIESYSFVHLDSLRNAASWSKPNAGGEQVFIGVPDLSGLQATQGNSAIGQLASQKWKTGELDAVNESLLAFQKFGSGGKVLRGLEASEEALANLADPSYLYLFTHGAYLDSSPGLPLWDRSVALFAPSIRRDGILLASETKLLALDGTRLAVLAICKSGSGGVRRNEPLDGLRTAFHVAGAESVIAPTWNVDIVSAANLIQRVFANTGDLDLALRDAQLALRDAKAPARAWAGWVLSGDPSRIR